MSVMMQDSLFDVADAIDVLPLGATVHRRELTRGAWIDHRLGWIEGSAELFQRLHDDVPWRGEQRQMYDNVVVVPRLLASYGASAPLPHPALQVAKDALNAHYRDELGEPFVTAGLCLYRDGRDSVAWHGDRIGRGNTEDTMVAILGLGASRTLSLRPRGGGEMIRIPLGHGDLVVMGGSCQRTWEHAVLKTAKPVGPRISVQFRPVNVF